jgi:hypothetical protein
MPSSGMLCHVALVITDISEECITSIIRLTIIGELCIAFLHSVLWLLVTVNVVPTSPILVTPMMEAVCSSETTVLTRAIQRNIPEDIFHVHSISSQHALVASYC